MNAGLIILRVASLGRDAQNERDGAGAAQLRRSSDSVAAATPSQLRRSSAARTMSGRRGSRKSSPLGKFAKNRGTHTTTQTL